MYRPTNLWFAGLIVFVSTTLSFGQVTINEGIDTTLAEADLRGPNQPHGGFDPTGKVDPAFEHPREPGYWEFDLADGLDSDGNPAQNYGLLWFDIPQTILNSFADNDSAILRMHIPPRFGPEGDPAKMHRMTADWITNLGNQVTFQNIPGGPGIVPGQNATTEPTSIWPSSLGLQGQVLQTDVSADVLAWASGKPNYGWGFVPTGNNGHGITSFEDEVDPVPTLIIAAGTEPSDCNGDGMVDINDVNCAGAVGEVDLANIIIDLIGSITGDADGSGAVEFSDFLVLANNFGQPGQYSDGDFDWNGTVEFSDFLILSNNFGKSGASRAAAVPEPNTAILLMAGGLMLFGCRRRNRKTTAPR